MIATLNRKFYHSKLWRLVIVLGSTFLGIQLPGRFALHFTLTFASVPIEYYVIALFGIDFLSGLYDRIAQSRATKMPDIFKKLITDPIFITDLLSAIPYKLIAVHSPLQVLNLLKIFSITSIMDEYRRRQFLRWNKLRLAFFAYWFVLAAHWLACGWIVVGGAHTKATIGSTYLGAIYWTITTLSTVGYGDVTPKSDVQMLYSMIVMILGAGVYGYVIGNIASIIVKRDPVKAQFIERMERLDAFMNYRQIPLELQKRISSFYTYLWSQRLGYDESQILTGLPKSLRTDLALTLSREIIEKVPMFRSASEGFIREIATHLKPIVFTPGDYVFHAGEIGHDMYFVAKGQLAVVAPDESKVLNTLTEGSFFGEMALFLEQPRSASVRAQTFCDLYILDKHVFDNIIKRYPDIAQQMLEVVKERVG